MAEQNDYFSPSLFSLEKQESKDTYYIPKFQQTIEAGEYSSERDIEINALKKMAGKNNNAFIMGMRNLDEPVGLGLFDGYAQRKTEERMGEFNSSAWEATKAGLKGFAQGPVRFIGYAATNSLPLIARTATTLYAMSGAAGGQESADKWVREANKGIEAWENEIKRATGIDDASEVESIVGNAIGSVWGSVAIGGTVGKAAVAPMFGVSALQDTYVRQREAGTGIGESLVRGAIHGTAETALESLQLNRIFGNLAKKSKPIAIVKDLFENALQEGTQQGAELATNWNIDNRELAEKLQEVGVAMVGGAVASLAGSVGGNILNRKTIDEVGDLMKKTGHTDEEIKTVKENLNKIVDTDELQQAANQVAKDELTTIALSYKEQAQAASEAIVVGLEDTIKRNELVDMGGALSGDKTEGMPPLYQLGDIQIDTQKNPNIGMVLYQADQEGKPMQTLGQVLAWTKSKLNVEQAKKMNTGINAVYNKTYEQLKAFGQEESVADANARVRSAMAYSIAKNYDVDVEQADTMLGGIVQQKASEFEGTAPVEVQEEVQKEVEKNVEKEVEAQTEQTQVPQETSLAEAVNTAVQEVAKTNKEVAEATKPTEKIEDYGEVLEGARKDLEPKQKTKASSTIEKIMNKVSDNENERIIISRWLSEQSPDFVEQISKYNHQLFAMKTPEYVNDLYQLYAEHPEVSEEKPRWRVANNGVEELSRDTNKKYGIKPSFDVFIKTGKYTRMLATPENLEAKMGNRGKVSFEFASSTRGDYFLWVKKGSQGWKPLMKFDSKEDAIKYKESHTEQELMDLYKEKSTVVKKEKPIRQRKGPDYRKGKNVTAEDFANTFGFRGVQFGNYENNDKRQKELNNAYDSLMDLATIVGIPPKAVSLEGTLGIAFGARGSGSAAAHYERSNKVINITRDSGAGAIGHEWFHALDNYFGGGTNMATKSFIGRNLRFELRDKLVDFLYSIETEKDFQNRLKLLGDYWKSKWEIAARVFEQYLVDKTEKSGIINDYLATEKDSAPYLTKDEQARILPKLDDFFKTMKYEEVNGKYRLYQSAYHGGPELEGGKFDLKFAEKAHGQTHGHGVYSTPIRVMANKYRVDIDEDFSVNGEKLSKIYSELSNKKEYKKAEIIADLLGNQDIFALEEGKDQYDKDAWDWFKKEIANKLESKGKLYELEIPEDMNLIDEQKTFSEQPEKVRFELVSAIQRINGFGLLEKAIESDATGAELYDAIGKDVFYDKKGYEGGHTETQKTASEYLSKHGIKGIKYFDNGIGFVIFNPDDVKIIQKFYQEQGGLPRGAYYNNTTYLFENANESTFVHEMAHSYMDVLERLANGGNAQAQNDLNVIRKWLGKKQGEAFTQADWERFARGFEMYMREGKSPNEYLGGEKGVFARFRDWLMHIYTGIKSIKVKNEKGKEEPVNINSQIKRFYDEMLGGQDIDKVFDTAEKNQQSLEVLDSKLKQLAEAQQKLAEEKAKLVREMANNVKPDTTWANVKDWGKNVWESAKELPTNVLQSSYERLAKIDARLGLLVQKAEQSQGLRIKKWADQIQPFYESFNKLSNEDKAKVQYFLLNQQWGDVEDVLGKEGTEAVHKVLEEIYNELVDSGVEVGYQDNYFPRAVLDYDGLLQEMGLTYPSLRKEMEAALGKDATPQEQAEWLDKHIMGFKGSVSLNQNRNTKERKLDLITDRMAKYYKPSMETLVDYMGSMAKLLSMREAFGRDIEYKESTAEESIGKIINRLFGNNELSKKEIDEVRDVLSALYLPNGVGNKFLQAMRQYGYATKLSYSTTVRQFADIGMMMKVNGVLNTLDALFHPDKRITLENLGIDPLGEEFQTSKKDIGGKIANIATKWKGINWADAIMKNAFMRGNYKALQKLAKTPDKFHEKYDRLFGDETDTLIKDLNENKISEPVKVLLFHEISKIQPISRSAMPTSYLSNPNGRVFYMFKTFSLHRAEYMVSELANDFRNGDLKKAGKDIMADVAVIGWEGLVELLIAFLKYGWQALAAKEVIETFAGSGLGVFGLNKHQALQISRGQVGDFFQEMVGVGTPLDDIGYMIRHYDDDDKLLRAFLPDMILEPLIAGPKPLGKKKVR